MYVHIKTCFVHFQHIFFGGLDPHLRHETWPFLLHYYPWDSTFEEREAIRNDRYIQYQDIRKMRYSRRLCDNSVAETPKHFQIYSNYPKKLKQIHRAAVI